MLEKALAVCERKTEIGRDHDQNVDICWHTPAEAALGQEIMNQHEQMGIHVDIGKNALPRLNFTIGEHSTSLDIDCAGAAALGGALLTSSFIAGANSNVPVGTMVSQGPLPVESVEGRVDPETNLPTLTVRIFGGAVITVILSPDLAAVAAMSLTEQIRAVVGPEAAPAPPHGTH